MKAAAAIAALLLSLHLHATPWDCDRPDATALEDLVTIMAGRFDQPEPAYYRARIDRLKPLIEGLPEQPTEAQLSAVLAALPHFDDAAVAMTRIGEHQEALVLLDRKMLRCAQVKVIDTAAGKRHHQRALANKAHALLDRYRKRGASEDLTLARAVIDELRALDRYDPEADWLLDEALWLQTPPAFDERAGQPFPNMLGITPAHLRLPRGQDTPAQAGMAGAAQWLALRIVHGGLWQDADAFHALGLALWLEGRDEEAITAWLRVNELVTAGGKSRVRNAPGSLVKSMGEHIGELPNLEEQQRLFAEIRLAGDDWVKQRNEYAAPLLAAGRHPDTDPQFWAAFGQPPLPQPGQTQPEVEPPVSMALLIGGISAFLVLLFVLAGFALFVGRRHPGAPTVDEA